MSLGQARRSFTTDYDDPQFLTQGGGDPNVSLADERRLQSSASYRTLSDQSLTVPLKSFAEGDGYDSSSSHSALGKPRGKTCFAPECKCRVSIRGCAISSLVFGVFIAVIAVLMTSVVGPHLAQSAIQHSTLTLIDCSMHDADNTSIGLDCNVRLDNAGGINATLRSLQVDVLHRENKTGGMLRRFGTMSMPRTDVLASRPTFIRIMSRLHVTDNSEFTKATAGVLQGRVGSWVVRGDATLDAHIAGVTITFPNILMEKEMLLPPTVLSDVSAFGFRIESSDTNRVRASANCSLLSVSVLELHSLGALSFSITDADTGGFLGEIEIPSFSVRRGYNQFDNVSASIYVRGKPGSSERAISQSAVTKFFRRFATGQDIRSTLIGPTSIKSGSPFLLNLVSQNVVITSPGSFVSDMTTSDIQILRGTSTTLFATAKGVFHSASTVVPGALGSIAFDLKPASFLPDGSVVAPTIGRVIMPPFFGVSPGQNSVVANVSLIKNGDVANNEAIEHFIDNYAMGRMQDMILVGPVNHPCKMLNGFLKQRITANGIANPNLVVGSILTHYSIDGFKVDSSGPGVASDGKMRGAVAIAGNPFAAHIRMTDVLYDIFLHDAIEYTVTNEFWTGGKPFHCPSTKKLARSAFGKGMQMYPMLCPGESCPDSNKNIDYMEFPPSAQRSFLSPAFPMPGQQILDPNTQKPKKCPTALKFLFPDMGCCYATLFFAAACRAQRQGDAHFLASTNGTMALQVGEFETRSSMGQDTLSFTYEAGLIDGFGAENGYLHCDNYAFPGEKAFGLAMAQLSK